MTDAKCEFPFNNKTLRELDHDKERVREHRRRVAADTALDTFYGFGWQSGMTTKEREEERNAIIRAVESFERIRDGK